MKKLTDEQIADIQDAEAAGLLNGLPAFVAEKDVHVTDALRVLANLNVVHEAQLKGFDPRSKKLPVEPVNIELPVRLVFAGGTCLSKAYNLISRMSEDIDIKVILPEVPNTYKLKNECSSDKARLKDIHKKLTTKLEELGFYLTDKEGENPEINDRHRHYNVDLSYQGNFSSGVSNPLRSCIKVELINRPINLSTEKLKINYLYQQLVNGKSYPDFDIECINISETLAEKVLSLLRRFAMYCAGVKQAEFDEALVRHIYDVWRIYTIKPKAINAAASMFGHSVKTDMEEYSQQFQAFVDDPYSVLSKSLDVIKNTKDGQGKWLNHLYITRLSPLVYSQEPHSYEEALASFVEVANHLLRALAEK
ncbi:inorganic pyrophosphatase/exopolyphosphatase [Yersinia enterocolitica]|uniref:nucleotidyl transferase AbiEii/AbiGii toxin family protein n=1 Tax=Yersinia TaxID=629 RepID=UPI000281980D|nr:MULTISPECIES: nucleotidyl transferase AbiEii/AbiGii toxin family protein [Yersinia]AJI82595.1 hypothetical protein CH47_3622 [Yersinia enterocolitica]EKA25894.1 inorganic pyrophosphatase/exopolyphosphatase [Yersinia enterocolitica subsp. enterocolitica WA-314]ELI8283155.1 nucleotidyl transferase AbiEii/AbiGii toxin family protein [Yersinia enterocolitica]KGA69012.1 hypothetical protein DJ59_2530 [Yersinia enterocolitica]KGA78546.1 hypothetical protein DJ60_2747 [Yersinia enterocolitica]